MLNLLFYAKTDVYATYIFFQIQIEIIRSYNITSVFDKEFIMCESDVYFETYRHVYCVLKSFIEETFPMKNYIIDVDVCAFKLNSIQYKFSSDYILVHSFF